MHVAAVSGGAYPEPLQLAGPDHVGEGHRRVHCHPVRQRRLGRRGVDVIIPAVVLDQLRQRAGLAKQRVDEFGGLVRADSPNPVQSQPESAYRF
jgi:hypothetical protein